MSKTAHQYVQAIAVIAAVAALLHYLAGLDWAWATVIGAAASILLRALLRPRATSSTTGEKEVRPR